VSERHGRIDLIVVAATLADAFDHPGGLEVGDDAMHASLGQEHEVRHVTQAEIRVSSQAEQHVGVVAQEGPPWRSMFAAGFVVGGHSILSLTP
jgi:hypothetical protein